ncbi:MAG: NAD(P)/FAD-dependent oxidoreductase [Gemmatimonadota bacterium]
MPDTTSSLGIVGGGVLGMTLALRLHGQGHRVTLIEGASAPGGLAATQQIGGYTWDRFYHVILLSDLNLRGLLAELGLEEQLRWGNTRTGFFTGGRLLSFSTTLDFFLFPPLSLVDKARLAGTILHASRIRDGRSLERIPVTDWLRRLSGRRTFERIWLPLLKSKLGENYRIASASFIWAIIARMYAARRSGLKREMFGYVDGGYALVLSRLRARLEAAGVEIRCGQRVNEVLSVGEGAELVLADGSRADFDDVILTVPCGAVSRLCPTLPPAARERLDGVVYQGIICASVLLRQPLAQYYVTNITESWVPFTAVIEMTTLVDRAAFGGNALVYLPLYLTADDPRWQRTDAEIREAFLAALQRMYPEFRQEDVLAFEVSRVREVLAVSTLDYTERSLPPVASGIDHVYVVNSAQIINGTLNLNETVGLANAKAAELAPLLKRHRAAEAPA